MAGDTRGTDFITWRNNRAAYREEAAGSIEKLHAVQARLVKAAAGAAASARPGSDSISEVLKKAETTIAFLTEARAKIPKLRAAVESEQTSLQTRISNVRASATQRTRQEAEQAARNKQISEQQFLNRKRSLRQLIAIGIAVVILFLIVVF